MLPPALLVRCSLPLMFASGAAAQAQHWAFAPLPREVASPQVGDDSWCRNGIDLSLIHI